MKHFPEKSSSSIAANLSKDPHATVRQQALYLLGAYHKNSPKTAVVAVASLADMNPKVAITACWVLTLIAPEEGQKAFVKWLQNSAPESRRLAAAALAATGKYGYPLAHTTFKSAEDPYVKLNLAISLLGQRIDTLTVCEELYHIHLTQKEKWMVDEEIIIFCDST